MDIKSVLREVCVDNNVQLGDDVLDLIIKKAGSIMALNSGAVGRLDSVYGAASFAAALEGSGAIAGAVYDIRREVSDYAGKGLGPQGGSGSGVKTS